MSFRHPHCATSLSEYILFLYIMQLLSSVMYLAICLLTQHFQPHHFREDMLPNMSFFQFLHLHLSLSFFHHFFQTSQLLSTHLSVIQMPLFSAVLSHSQFLCPLLFLRLHTTLCLHPIFSFRLSVQGTESDFLVRQSSEDFHQLLTVLIM